MYPKGISPKLLLWLPRNGLLNILLYVIFAVPVIIQSIITWAFFIVLKNEFHHFNLSKSAELNFYYFLWILARHSPISCKSFSLGSR